MTVTDAHTRSGAGLKARIIWLVLGVAFAVTLGVMVGQRLSSEAMAVIVGVVAGVVASIPTSLIVVFVAARAMGGKRETEGSRTVAYAPPEPRVVVMPQPPMFNGQVIPAQAWPNAYGPAQATGYPAMPMAPRKFTIVGGAGTEYGAIEGMEADPWAQ